MYGVLKASASKGAEWREDLPIPEVGPRDLLVKVKAAAICGTDHHIYNWTPWAQARVKPPMVFGHEFSGEVVQVGDEVRRFAVGDRVAGETHLGCGSCYQCLTGNMHVCEDMKIIGVHIPGCFAEYISLHESCAWRLSEDQSYEVGALLEPMGVAMHGIQAAEVGGRDVVLYGAGPIGLMATSICRAYGASQVIVVEPAAAKLELAMKMGASLVSRVGIDDTPALVKKATKGRGADVVIDYSGSGQAIAEGLQVLRKGGRMVLVGLPEEPVSLDLTDGIIYREATVVGVTGRTMYGTWFECEKALSSGKLDISPVVGGRYPLREFERAFADIAARVPGKMILIP